MNILVTGGAGYIGSHTCVALIDKGFDVTVIDNLSNSSSEAVSRIQEITGKPVTFFREDLRDEAAVDMVFKSEPVDCVIHFAGLKSVSESVATPLDYYENNIVSTLVLCDAMKRYGVNRLVFSSSATVYGNPAAVPVREDAPLGPVNPYGRCKRMIEEILIDLASSDPALGIVLLRYFNPAGAHESGRIGEDPSGIPNNLMPYVSQVAVGRLAKLNVYGNDYPTPDGTGVRDYIHVMDLAEGHVAAVEKCMSAPGVLTVNLGTGRGYSVLDVVSAFEIACGNKIPLTFIDRRKGDIPACYADPSLARKVLGWQAARGINEICKDAWNWQKKNPGGYGQ